MKNYYLLLFLFFGLFGKAQIISIPDANFKAKLLAASPSIGIAKDINGNNIKIDLNNNTEIEVSEVLNVRQLLVYSSYIQSLDGISYFSNLIHLNCSNNQLSNLNLSGLLSLNSLICSYNQLSNLNVSGVFNLNYLHCSDNALTNLNVSGLLNLQNLICSNNQLPNLNVSGLVNIIYLHCSNNQISTLNTNGLINLASLFCSNNLLTNLFIKNNKQENIEFSGNANLQYICSDDLDINNIQLKIAEYGYSNCHVNTYCSYTPGGIFYSIQGQQKFDNENNGCDVTDDFIPNLKYSITNGSTTSSLISNHMGNYSVSVQSGSHTITPILENPNYFTVSPTNIVVNFPTQTSPVTQNFCLIPIDEIHDVEISILPINPARPGFDCNYKIVYKNKGNQTENGTINFAYDDTVFDFVSSSVATSSLTFGNINWNYSNLQPFETRSINVVLNLNSPIETPAVNGGDVVDLTATITAPGEIPCNNWLQSQCDNVFTLNQTVVNSYDPNDKTCLEGNSISPDRVGGYVHYMIRFENTGTFPAENIVVKDMIDTAKFDVNSLIPLNASHNYVTKITDNKVEFIFENINLPFDDVNNDGYVAFKIKTLPTLVVGNTFSNSANIYFDYNFPIVTNTATTTIAALSNPSFEFANYFSLYPNPTNNELNINLKSAVEINSIQIYNTIGQLVTVQTGNALKVDVSNLKTGNYFVKINTNEGFSSSQFIKE